MMSLLTQLPIVNPGAVPEMVWRDWPILAVLATIVFAQFGLLSFVVLRVTSKLEKLTESNLAIVAELKALIVLQTIGDDH